MASRIDDKKQPRCSFCNKPQSQVRKMIANEELPAVKVGREWRVLKAGIVQFFEKQICY